MAFLLAQARYEYGRLPDSLLTAFTDSTQWAVKRRCTTPKIPRISKGVPESLDEQRLKALARWRWILEAAGPHSKTYTQLVSLTAEASAQMLEHAFYGKSTNTLRKRACTFLLYVGWAGGRTRFRLSEQSLYDYVSYLRHEGAFATRATSFLEAVNFAVPLLGLVLPPDATSSARLRGGALASLDRKGVTQQSPPFETRLVEALEVAVESARTPVDRAIVGFALFTLYAHARGSDSARAPNDPELDVDEQGRGYVEVRTTGLHVKTGRGKRRRLRMFPMVGAACGLRDTNWAQAWIQARQDCGLSAVVFGCLQPTVALGEFQRGIPMGTEELMTHVRRVVRTVGAPPGLLRGNTSHSLKATCLSWCAKAGIRPSFRRALGGHALPKDVSVMECSRDALAAPLQELDRVIDWIRSGRFDPDVARSGRWKQPAPDEPESVASGDTDSRHITFACGENTRVECDVTYYGASVGKCAVCLQSQFEYLSWPEGERVEWDSHFEGTERRERESDANSERFARPVPARPEEDPGSELSSSNDGSRTEVPGKDSGDDADVVAAVASQIPVEAQTSDSSDHEGCWLYPSRWGRPLVRHAARFTVHAVRDDGKLLCGRVRGPLHVDAAGLVDDWPACRICQARTRAYGPQRVELASGELKDDDIDEQMAEGAEGGEPEANDHDPETSLEPADEPEEASDAPR